MPTVEPCKAASSQEDAAKREVVISHVRRIFIEVVNLVIGYDWFFGLVGFFNKRMRLIESVFLVYPANEEYAHAYVYPRRLLKVRWSPWLCGVLLQNGRLTVMFCISATNKDFNDPANMDRLRSVVSRMEALKILFGAQRKSFAGILPGVLFKITKSAPEADLTAEAVCQAIDKVREDEKFSSSTPVIVLGGRGFVGRRVVKLLKRRSESVYSVDLHNRSIPSCLRELPVIVVNITLNGSLSEYVDDLWPRAVVLNEVYPEPSPRILYRLSLKGCSCYHVVGVRAKALPAFPRAYRGGIPCCAAWPSPNMKVFVRKMV